MIKLLILDISVKPKPLTINITAFKGGRDDGNTQNQLEFLAQYCLNDGEMATPRPPARDTGEPGALYDAVQAIKHQQSTNAGQLLDNRQESYNQFRP